MKTLIIGPSWIGDMMMSNSLYRLLKNTYPGIEIDVMAPSWCYPLLARMPEVNRKICIPFEHNTIALRERINLGRSIKIFGYNQSLVLPNSFKSALIPFFANIPQRTGWRGEMRYGLLNDIRILNKTIFPLMVQRYAALAFDKKMITSSIDLPLFYPHLLIKKEESYEVLSFFDINSKIPIIGFCHGAEFGPAKRWPHYHYAALANLLITQGYQIVLLGSSKDYLIGENIIRNLPKIKSIYCRNLSGKTSLDQAILLIASCQAVISNDSGLMHIASALNRPLIVLYGPSSPEFTPPLSKKAIIIRLISGYYKIRKGREKHGYHESLIDIQPTNVLKKLELLLSYN